MRASATAICALVAAGAMGALAAQAQETYSVPATVIQTIADFDNPEGAIFSADGDAVFISNAAEIGDRAESLGWTEGEGYISKLAVHYDGQLRMISKQLIKGLTGPLGMGVLPVATGEFPEGTIIVASGSAPLVDSEGKVVTDPSRLQTKLIFTSEQGDVLGEIATGADSAFHEISGAPVALLNALGTDAEGNIYFADTAFGADQFDPPFEPRGGVWMIPHGSIDALAAGDDPAEPPVFLAVPGNPDGVEVSPEDGKIYVNTVGPVAGAEDPADGGVYALTKEDISSGTLPEPVDTGLGALDGLDFTAGGVMLNTQIKGDVDAQIYVHCPRGKAQVLEMNNQADPLAGPADLAVHTLANGAQLLVVPELMARDATPGDDEVTVMMLPPEFDEGC
jgi:hypothetical protein